MIGCLIAEFIIQTLKDNMPKNPMVVKSIVTSKMVEKICQVNKVDCFASFTGFRFIAELIDSKVGYHSLLAFEESYGYLMGDYTRDKDALVASAIITQMACYYKAKSMNLLDALDALYTKYGYYLEKTLSITMSGADGLAKMQALMKDFRENPKPYIADTKVSSIKYYSDGYSYDFKEFTKMELEGSDVVAFELEDGTTFIVRPSGTEPKVKVYILADSDSYENAQIKIDKFAAFSATMFL